MTEPAQSPSPPGIPPEPSFRHPERGGPRLGSIIVGLVILGIGLWYFADRTLGLDLPDIDARDLWPVALIALGAWLIVRPNR